MELSIGDSIAVVGLVLHLPERSELTLALDDPFDGRGSETSNELVLEIFHTRVETERLEARPRRCAAEDFPDVALGAGVVQTGESDVTSVTTEERYESPEVGNTSHRNNGNPLVAETSVGPRRDDLERDGVAESFDQYHRHRVARALDGPLDGKVGRSRSRLTVSNESREVGFERQFSLRRQLIHRNTPLCPGLGTRVRR